MRTHTNDSEATDTKVMRPFPMINRCHAIRILTINLFRVSPACSIRQYSPSQSLSPFVRMGFFSLSQAFG